MTLADPIKESKGGVAQVERKPTIEEMKRALGFDNVRPIHVNSDDVAEDLVDTGDAFADWYEEDLRKHYEQLQQDADKR